jgi:hemolysin III
VPARTNLGDILANAITHGIGAVLAIAGAIYLIAQSTRASPLVALSCAIFAVTLVLVYLCSTLYHALILTRARPVFHILDHSSIYLLIAGTYTPFTLISLRGPLGWSIFSIEWALAIAGVLSKSLAMEHFKAGRMAVLSAAVYLLQGWVIVFAVGQLVHAIGWHGLAWLGAGGPPTRSVSSSSLSIVFATSTLPGTSSSSPAVSLTTPQSSSTYCPPRARNRTPPSNFN